MRRIIASVNTTLDGYMEEPGGEAISTGSCRSSRMASQIARNGTVALSEVGREGAIQDRCVSDHQGQLGEGVG